MFLNIITPCSRPENLHVISETINIPKENYRWIVVFDMDELPKKELIPLNCEPHLYREKGSVVGHAQRNYALNIIDDGYIYFNDDDTSIHPELWETIKNCNSNFISFIQLNKNGTTRLVGKVIDVRKIDSHNFIISRNTVGVSKFFIDKYDADGYFAKECYNKSLTKTHFNKPLSIYNLLR
jgi:hypothetical protein